MSAAGNFGCAVLMFCCLLIFLSKSSGGWAAFAAADAALCALHTYYGVRKLNGRVGS